MNLKKLFVTVCTVALLSSGTLSSANAMIADAAGKTYNGITTELLDDRFIHDEDEVADITIKVTNNNEFDVKNVSVKGLIPKGLVLVSGNKESKIGTIEAGETVRVKLKVAKEGYDKPVVTTSTTVTTKPTTTTTKKTTTTTTRTTTAKPTTTTTKTTTAKPTTTTTKTTTAKPTTTTTKTTTAKPTTTTTKTTTTKPTTTTTTPTTTKPTTTTTTTSTTITTSTTTTTVTTVITTENQNNDNDSDYINLDDLSGLSFIIALILILLGLVSPAPGSRRIIAVATGAAIACGSLVQLKAAAEAGKSSYEVYQAIAFGDDEFQIGASYSMYAPIWYSSSPKAIAW